MSGRQSPSHSSIWRWQVPLSLWRSRILAFGSRLARPPAKPDMVAEQARPRQVLLDRDAPAPCAPAAILQLRLRSICEYNAMVYRAPAKGRLRGSFVLLLFLKYLVRISRPGEEELCRGRVPLPAVDRSAPQDV